MHSLTEFEVDLSFTEIESGTMFTHKISVTLLKNSVKITFIFLYRGSIHQKQFCLRKSFRYIFPPELKLLLLLFSSEKSITSPFVDTLTSAIHPAYT